MVKIVEAIAAGGPEVLTLKERDLLSPKAHEVQITHTAIGVNFHDISARRGKIPGEFPRTPGIEAVGIVEKIGQDVSEFKVGDRVTYYDGQGAYASARNIDQASVVKVPEPLTDELVAASFVKGLTAHMLIKQVVEVKAGDTIVVHSAAGGVGSILCQWAKALGAKVIGLVGSEAKVHEAKAAKCDHVFTLTMDWPNEIRKVCGEGADVVYDSVGQDTFRSSMTVLRKRGFLVAFGNSSGLPPEISPMELMLNGSIYLARPAGNDFFGTPDSLRATAVAWFDCLMRGGIDIKIGQRFSLENAIQAHQAIESRNTTGSTLLIP